VAFDLLFAIYKWLCLGVNRASAVLRNYYYSLYRFSSLWALVLALLGFPWVAVVLILGFTGGVSYLSFLTVFPSFILALARVSFSLRSLFKGVEGCYPLLFYPLLIIAIGLCYYFHRGLSPLSFTYFCFLFLIAPFITLWLTLHVALRGALLCAFQLFVAFLLALGSSLFADLLFNPQFLFSLLFSFTMLMASSFLFMSFTVVVLYPLVHLRRSCSFDVLLFSLTPFFVLFVVILTSLFYSPNVLLAKRPAMPDDSPLGSDNEALGDDEGQPIEIDIGPILPFTYDAVFTPEACASMHASPQDNVPALVMAFLVPDVPGETSDMIKPGVSFTAHVFSPDEMRALDISPYELLDDSQVCKHTLDLLVSQAVASVDSSSLSPSDAIKPSPSSSPAPDSHGQEEG